MNKRCYFILVLLVLFSLSVSAYNHYGGYFGGYDSYFSSYGGYFGGYDLLGMYYQYNQIVDFLIFLVIFIGLTQSVFGEHFQGRSGRAVYVGIGVLLAASLVVWEQRTGFILLENLGPWAIFILIIIFAFYLYRAISGATGGSILAASIAYLLFVFFFNNIGSYYDLGILGSLYNIPFFNSFFGLTILLAFIGVIWGLFRLLFRRSSGT